MEALPVLISYATVLVFGAVILIAVFSNSNDDTAGSGRQHQDDKLRSARVHRVIDGDTVIVATDWRMLTLRLEAIDCPEHGQHWGDIARFGLAKLIGGRRIRFEDHGFDRYGRTLATVYVRQHGGDRWTNVNLRMLALGHAWVSRNLYSHLPSHRRKELSRVERWARSRHVGLWRAASPTPPWQWRAEAGKSSVTRLKRVDSPN